MATKRCKTGVQNDLSLGQPIIEFVTITVPAALAQVGIDIPVVFKTPHTYFMICSIAAAMADASVFLSFGKIGFNSAGSTQISPTGGESWLPFSNKASSTKPEGRFVKFNRPVQSFFISADHPSNNPAANQYFMTIAGTDDIEYIISERT